jgi:hypothetical protein
MEAMETYGQQIKLPVSAPASFPPETSRRLSPVAYEVDKLTQNRFGILAYVVPGR